MIAFFSLLAACAPVEPEIPTRQDLGADTAEVQGYTLEVLADVFPAPERPLEVDHVDLPCGGGEVLDNVLQLDPQALVQSYLWVQYGEEGQWMDHNAGTVWMDASGSVSVDCTWTGGDDLGDYISAVRVVWVSP